jgi:hypothetical protein
MPIELSNSAFQPGATIPRPYTGNGEDRSAPLRWSEPPDGTNDPRSCVPPLPVLPAPGLGWYGNGTRPRWDQSPPGR